MRLDHISISFHDGRIAFRAHGAARKVQTIKRLAFMKNRGFRRVNVFGQGVIKHTPPKANNPVLNVKDRNHQTVAEEIIGAAV